MRTRFWAASVAASLAGCASTPDVQVSYFLPAAEATIKVVETVDCTKNNEPAIGRAPTMDTRYFADVNRPQTFRMKALQRYGANADVTFEFYDDGRLKSLNASTVGKGEDVAKAAITVASAAALLAFTAAPAPAGPICGTLVDPGHAVTLTYLARPRLSAGGASTYLLALEPGASKASKDLAALIAPMTLDLGAPVELAPRAQLCSQEPAGAGHVKSTPCTPAMADRGSVSLRLSSVERVHYELWRWASKDEGGALMLLEGDLTVPHPTKTVDYPIPKAALFGKQTFTLALGDSGLPVTKVGYSHESGAAGALNVVSGALTAAQPQTATQKAADLKAEADVIQQQTRLMKCKLDAMAC